MSPHVIPCSPTIFDFGTTALMSAASLFSHAIVDGSLTALATIAEM